jgi:hypothetical protein
MEPSSSATYPLKGQEVAPGNLNVNREFGVMSTPVDSMQQV